MTIKKFLFLCVTLFAFAFAQNPILSEFDNNFEFCAQIDKEKLYDKIKHLYIESIMYGNDVMKYETLTRLIQGAKELDYDHLVYEKELNTLIRLNPSISDVAEDYLQKETNKTDASNASSPEDTLSDNSTIFTGDIVKIEQIADYIPELTEDANLSVNEDFNNQTAQLQDLSLSTPKLTQARIEEGKIIFTFDKGLSDIKTFILKGDNFRYIYDIKAIKTSSPINLKIGGIKDLRISQFDKETIRVVFEHSKEFDISQVVNGSELIFAAKEFYELKDNASLPQTNSAKNSSISEKTDNKTASEKSNATAAKVTIAQKTIVIDAGHGGKDSGARFNKKLEKEAVLQIALLLGGELEKRGYKVRQTRSKDIYLKLQERTKIANDKNADIFVSVHANAAPKKGDGNWQGIETFFLSPTDSKRSKNAAELENQSDVEEMNFYSKQTFLNFLNREKIIASHKLAIDIQQYILTSLKKKYTDVVDGGVREAPFWVLTGAQMPAVLLEVGYITDKSDRERMFDKKFQQTLIEGIANGIDSYFIKNM